jgi:hypothetical protein
MPVEMVWTALPDGRTDTGALRLSAHLAPRLSTAGGWDTRLGDEPDFADLLDWPPADLHLEVVFDHAGAFEARIVSDPPRPELWRSVFPPETPVRSFGVPDMTDTPLHTYPSSKLADWLRDAYARVAAAAPTDHPTVGALEQLIGLSDLNLTAGRAAVRRRAAAEGWLRDWLAEIRVVDTRTPTTLTQDAFLFEDFFAPAPVDPEVEFATPPDPPDPDLHQGLTFVGQHRHLQRLLGVVYDVEVDADVPLGATAVQVYAHWRHAAAVDTRHPRTTCEVRADDFRATSSSEAVADGYLRLEDVERYHVAVVDVDGAMMKLGDLAGDLERRSTHRTTDTPGTSAVPALRTGGIVVSELGHAALLREKVARALDLDAALASDPLLYAEDVTRGYRVDVQDVAVGTWRSLMQRKATYDFVDLGVTERAEDEGVVSAPIARRPGPDDLYVGEELCTWDGWSLVASRPGRILASPPVRPQPSDPGQPVPDDPLREDPGDPPGDTFRVSIGATVMPGTLPMLRVGRSYRLRVRTVDLANNSVPFDEHGDDEHASPEVHYGRLEPIATPPVLLRTPPGPGASVEHVVLRSDLDPPPSPATAERHLVVPKVGQQTVEVHGAIDVPDPAGLGLSVPDGSVGRWRQLSELDAATVETHPEAVVLPIEDDEAPLTVLDVDQLTVTWSPDPLARGIRVAFLDGPHAGEVRRLPFSSTGDPWPEAWAVRLVVTDGPGPVRFDGASRVLEVPLAKGEVTHVRLSSVLEGEDLPMLGLPRWLRWRVPQTALADLEEAIVEGEHWMVTPFRTLRLAHAVRQPLRTPEFTHPPSPSRTYGATYATLRGELGFSRRSTGRVDWLARWGEPVDDGPGSGAPDEAPPWSRQREAVAFSVDVEHGDAHDPDVLAYAGRQEFGDTRHREVSYHAVATTRFLEQFARTDTFPSDGPSSSLVLPTGGQPIAAGTLRLRCRDGDVAHAVDESAYTLDAETGQVTFGDGTTGEVPPAGTTVRATYTTGPVTRVTADPPEGRGRPVVSIPSSVRPAVPVLRYAVPTFSWERTEGAGGDGEVRRIDSLRRGGGLRLYLERPWWSSGAGELLGVLVWPGATGTGLIGDADRLKGFVSEWGDDPVHAAQPLPTRPPRVTSFPGARTTTTVPTSLAETGSASAQGVHVAGHEVRFDDCRDLWYCDIEVDTGAAYAPFLRLALARWQPSSLPHARLSPVVLAQFIQPAPDRLVTLHLVGDERRSLRVSLAGPASGRTSVGPGPGIARVTVERLVYPARGELGWEPVGSPTTLAPGGTLGAGLWTGLVTLPAGVPHRELRLVVEQFERLHTEPVRPRVTANPWGLSSTERLVHTDVVPIGPLDDDGSGPRSQSG